MKVLYKNKINIIVLLFLLNNNIGYSQILDSAIFIVSDTLDIPDREIRDYFLKCENYSDTTFTGVDTIIANFKNEKINIFIEYKTGKKTHAIGYWNNGNKYRETYYNGFTNHGWDISWYKNGQRKDQNFYDNGIPFCPAISWYEDGRIKLIFNYYYRKFPDMKQFIISWHNNGKLEDESFYFDSTDADVHIGKEYYENGQLKSESIYNAGKQKYYCYYDNGIKAWDGYIYNALWGQLGKWEEWDKSGAKSREYYFNDSIPNVREGIWKWWDENGYLIKEEIYKNDKLLEKKEYVNNAKKD